VSSEHLAEAGEIARRCYTMQAMPSFIHYLAEGMGGITSAFFVVYNASGPESATSSSKEASCGRTQHVSFTLGTLHSPPSLIRKTCRSWGSSRNLQSFFETRLTNPRPYQATLSVRCSRSDKGRKTVKWKEQCCDLATIIALRIREIVAGLGEGHKQANRS
jgi:hypothetical protein